MSITPKKDWQRLVPKPEHKLVNTPRQSVFMDENAANVITSGWLEFAKMPIQYPKDTMPPKEST